MDRDLEHLKLLSIFHYIYAGLVGLTACVPLLDVAFGTGFVFGGPGMGPRGPALGVDWDLVIVGGALMLIGWAFAALTVAAGRCLGRRKHYTFCLVIACLSCLQVPWGTVLGIFTNVVLCRRSVCVLFRGGAPVRPPAVAPET